MKRNLKTISFTTILLLIVASYIYFAQQRQYYYISPNLTITTWGKYLIFDKYTSFFPPNNDCDFIYFHKLPEYLMLPFVDSTTFILHTSSAEEITISLQKFAMDGLYSGRLGRKDLFLRRCLNDVFCNNPPYELGFEKIRNRLIPSINWYSDSTYYRIAYDYPDILMMQRDSIVYDSSSIRHWIKYYQE